MLKQRYSSNSLIHIISTTRIKHSLLNPKTQLLSTKKQKQNNTNVQFDQDVLDDETSITFEVDSISDNDIPPSPPLPSSEESYSPVNTFVSNHVLINSARKK